MVSLTPSRFLISSFPLTLAYGEGRGRDEINSCFPTVEEHERMPVCHTCQLWASSEHNDVTSPVQSFPLPLHSHMSLGFVPTATERAEQCRWGWEEAPGLGEPQVRGWARLYLSLLTSRCSCHHSFVCFSSEACKGASGILCWKNSSAGINGNCYNHKDEDSSERAKRVSPTVLHLTSKRHLYIWSESPCLPAMVWGLKKWVEGKEGIQVVGSM